MNTNTETDAATTDVGVEPPLMRVAGLLSIKSELEKRMDSVDAEIKEVIAKSPGTMRMLRKLVATQDSVLNEQAPKQRRPRKDRGVSRVPRSARIEAVAEAPAQPSVEPVGEAA